MGLDTTHDCWHGPYSMFMRWRRAVAQAAGLPPLDLMEGFFTKGGHGDPFRDFARACPELANVFYRSLPIRWEALRPSPLHILLSHSDCDGRIETKDCGPIADALETVIPYMVSDAMTGSARGIYDGIVPATRRFIAGLRVASSQEEDVIFS